MLALPSQKPARHVSVSADDGFCREPEKQFRNLHSDDRETGGKKTRAIWSVDGCSTIKHEKQLLEVKSKKNLLNYS
jgi:hypothetical protein